MLSAALGEPTATRDASRTSVAIVPELIVCVKLGVFAAYAVPPTKKAKAPAKNNSFLTFNTTSPITLNPVAVMVVLITVQVKPLA